MSIFYCCFSIEAVVFCIRIVGNEDLVVPIRGPQNPPIARELSRPKIPLFDSDPHNPSLLVALNLI